MLSRIIDWRGRGGSVDPWRLHSIASVARSCLPRDEMAGRSVRCGFCSSVPKVPAADAELPPGNEDTDALVPKNARPFAIREYLHLVLLLALIPLIMSILSPKESTIEARLKATIDRSGPETLSRVQAVGSHENASMDDLLEILPEGKLDEMAHLPAHHLDSLGLWRPGRCRLLDLHPASFSLRGKVAPSSSAGRPVHGNVRDLAPARLSVRRGGDPGRVAARAECASLIFYVVKFIGWSYASANDPESEPGAQLRGLHLGVGLCEELCKALPILITSIVRHGSGWRGALSGLASGCRLRRGGRILYSSRY